MKRLNFQKRYPQLSYKYITICLSQSQSQERRVSFAEERGTLTKRTPSAPPDRSTGQFEFVDDRSGAKIISNSGSGNNDGRRNTGKQQPRRTGRSRKRSLNNEIKSSNLGASIARKPFILRPTSNSRK